MKFRKRKLRVFPLLRSRQRIGILKKGFGICLLFLMFNVIIWFLFRWRGILYFLVSLSLIIILSCLYFGREACLKPILSFIHELKRTTHIKKQKLGVKSVVRHATRPKRRRLRQIKFSIKKLTEEVKKKIFKKKSRSKKRYIEVE